MAITKHTFKTNINCGGCIKAVTPHLEKVTSIISWKVDTENPDKILTIESENLSAEDIIALIKKAGFNIEQVQN